MLRKFESEFSDHLNQTTKSQLRDDNILTCKIPKSKKQNSMRY